MNESLHPATNGASSEAPPGSHAATVERLSLYLGDALIAAAASVRQCTALIHQEAGRAATLCAYTPPDAIDDETMEAADIMPRWS